MAIDLTLAIAHHLLVFALVAVLAMELILVRAGMDAAAVKRVARIDLHYGAIAVLVLAVGFLRAFYGLKGPDYYFASHVFWTKVGLFVLLGLLSIPPTVKFLSWRKAAQASQAVLPDARATAAVKRYIVWELVVVALILAAAAALARGIGAN